MKSAKLFALAIFMVLSLFILRAEGADVSVFGAGNAAIIAAPDSVRAWRTVASLNPDDRDLTDWYKKSGKGKLVSHATAAQLSKVLLDAHTYPHFDGPGKACLPEPGVALAFAKGNHIVELYVCFQCDIMTVYNPTDGKAPHWGAGGDIDFDSGHNKLLSVVKKIFPKDQQIQALTNREE